MEALGVSWATVAAWEASCQRFLGLLEVHLSASPGGGYILGDAPSVADFALLGPIYAHLSRDPVPRGMMEREYPKVMEWCRRCHGDEEQGEEERVRSEWPADDAVAPTIEPMIEAFFEEMMPMLQSTCRALGSYLTHHHQHDGALPGKSFSSECMDQLGDGPLTHSFKLPFSMTGRPNGVSEGRRMVVPYQVWMLQRIEGTLGQIQAKMESESQFTTLITTLAGPVSTSGKVLLDLPALLRGCRVEKRQGLIYPATTAAARRGVAQDRSPSGLSEPEKESGGGVWQRWWVDWRTTILLAVCLTLARKR